MSAGRGPTAVKVGVPKLGNCLEMYTCAQAVPKPVCTSSVQEVAKQQLQCTRSVQACTHAAHKLATGLGTYVHCQPVSKLGHSNFHSRARGIHDIIFSRFCMMFNACISHASHLIHSIFTVSAHSCNSNFIGYNFLYGHTHCKHCKHIHCLYSRLIRKIRSDEFYIPGFSTDHIVSTSSTMQLQHNIIISVCNLHLCWCVSNKIIIMHSALCTHVYLINLLHCYYVAS